MADWTTKVASPVPIGTLSTAGEGSALMDTMIALNSPTQSGVWDAVNRAIYTPVIVSVPVTVFQMALTVVTSAAGNVDVGIYDYLGNRLVSAGVTAIAASGVQAWDVTDTYLTPSVYYLAGWCSTVTTASFQMFNGAQTATRVAGVQNEGSLASGLPATAAFSAATTNKVPLIVASLNATF